MFQFSAAVLRPGVGFRLSSGEVLPTTAVFDMYWYFAAERQSIYHKRIENLPPPWTSDPILRAYRFTNVYRAADRVSQFLIRHVIYEGEQSASEVFFRTMMFKFFNKIETWQLFKEKLGLLSWSTFNLDRYVRVLDEAKGEGSTIYSPAYIIPSPRLGSQKKHVNHLRLLELMMQQGASVKIAGAKSLENVYLTLRAFPSIGDFLAFQFAIDLNYSAITNFSEMDFVVAGPGARSGIRKAFRDRGGLSDEQLIREVANAADREFSERNLVFRKLENRPLQLIDCQNLFCEVDKYSRVALPDRDRAGRTRIKRRFEASAADSCPTLWYPPKWRQGKS